MNKEKRRKRKRKRTKEREKEKEKKRRVLPGKLLLARKLEEKKGALG